VPRRRAAAALTLEEREEISCGIAVGRSLRQIAQGLGPSVILITDRSVQNRYSRLMQGTRQESHRYRIEYLRDRIRIGTEIAAGTLEATQQAARVGMIERQADFAYIIDDETGAEIWSESRSAGI
jgi:hypothetical protein